jgi:hypothetical protein
MRVSKTFAAIAVLALMACGGGGGDDDGSSNNNGNPTGPTGNATNGSFRAVIGGANWSAIGQVTVTRQTNFIGIAGSGSAGSSFYAVVLSIGNATGAGTHSFALAGGGDGSSLIIGNSAGIGWGTAFNGGTGSVTITTLTANHIVGTFSGTAIPSSGTGGNLVVTNGTFDITF